MTNQTKLQSPFEQLKKYHEPEVAIRIAIIVQAYQDATSIARDKKAQKAKKEAMDWIFNETEDFLTLCHEVDINPQLVILKTKYALSLQKSQNTAQQEKNNNPSVGNTKQVVNRIFQKSLGDLYINKLSDSKAAKNRLVKKFA